MHQMLQQFFATYPVAGTIVAALVAAHALASFIVNLTPTPKDNQWLKRVYTVVELLAAVGVTAKDKGDSTTPAQPSKPVQPAAPAKQPVAAQPAVTATQASANGASNAS